MSEFFSKKHANRALYLTLCMQLLASFIILFIPEINTNTFSGFLVLMIKYALTESSFLVAFILLIRSRKNQPVKWKTVFGLDKKVDLLSLLLCVLGGISFFALSYHFFGYLDSLLIKVGFTQMADPFALNTWPKFIISIIPLALMPALFEELIYRGVVLNGLEDFGKTKAIILSSVFFAVMHMGVFQLFYQITLAVFFAILVQITKDIRISMSMHFANNFVVLLFSFLNSKFGIKFYFFQNIGFWISLALFVVAIALIVLVIYIIKRRTQNCTQTVSRELISQEENQKINISLIFIMIFYVMLAILNSLVV